MSSPRAAWSSASRAATACEDPLVLGDDVVGAVVVTARQAGPGRRPACAMSTSRSSVTAGSSGRWRPRPARRRHGGRCTRCRRAPCETPLWMTTRARSSGSGTARHSRERQSSSRAWPATPQAEANWSMSPHLTPTCSFSARCATLARSMGGKAGPSGPESAQAADDLECRGRGQARADGQRGQQDAVEPVRGLTGLLQRPGRAGHVVVPGIARRRQGSEVERRHRPAIQAGQADARAHRVGRGRCARPCRWRTGSTNPPL